MSNFRALYGPHNPDATYVEHSVEEQLVDLGEVAMNYATLGDASLPALLLIPGQTESWWGYEKALPLLAEHLGVRRPAIVSGLSSGGVLATWLSAYATPCTTKTLRGARRGAPRSPRRARPRTNSMRCSSHTCTATTSSTWPTWL